MSSVWRFHIYPVTHSSIESTKILDIGRNFSYFLNLQYESRRLSSYLFKVDIDRLVAQHEDGRTDGRNSFSSLKSNDETRRHRKISVVCSADVELRTDNCQPCTIVNLKDELVAILFSIRAFEILFRERSKMQTGPNWCNGRLFKCNRIEGRPFPVVSKVNSVLGTVDFLFYGRVADFFFTLGCLNLPLKGL